MSKFCHNSSYKRLRNESQSKPKKIMTNAQKISILRETLEDCVLTPAERQTIWAEIAQLEAKAS